MAKKVLLVDDEQDIVELLRYNLEREGIEVIKAANGREALQKAKPREVSRERAGGKPEGSRIVKAADAQIVTGVVGMAGAAASVIAPAVETAERAKDVTERTVGLLNLSDWLMPLLPWAGAVIFLIVIVLACKAKAARIEDFRIGKTP